MFGKRKSGKAKETAAAAVQTSAFSNRRYARMGSFANLGLNNRVYRSLRENVPVIDAAVLKIIRLMNDFTFETGSAAIDAEMNGFFEAVDVGGNQTGFSAEKTIRSCLGSFLPPL